MNKEIELEADKYARRFEENELSGYNGESLSIEDRMEMEAFIAGATSKYVKKQAFEFAKFCLNKAKDLDIHTVYHRIEPTFQEFLKTKQ